MTGLKSRNKGKTGEREVLNFIQGAMIQVEHSLDVPEGERLSRLVQRNLQQSIDGGDDIVNVPGHSVEVKNCAVLALPAWWAQCQRQAQARGLRPLLVYRQGKGRGVCWMARTWMLSASPDGSWVVCDMELGAYLVAFKNFYSIQLKVFAKSA